MVLSIVAVTVLIPILWAQGRIDAARVAGESSSGDPLVGITRPFRLWVVRDLDGTSISWRSALLRTAAMYFVSSVLYLGLIWIFIDKRRRSGHDLVAGTVVIRRA